MSRKRDLALALLLSLSTMTSSLIPPVLSQEFTVRSLTLTVFFDGYVSVDLELLVNQSVPSINVTLLGQTFEGLLVVDEDGLPLDYSLVGREITVYSLGASQSKITYFTQDLTSKNGQYWILEVDAPANVTIRLPAEASVMSLNVLPFSIESTDGQITLIMPAGLIEVSYIISRRFFQPSLGYEVFVILLAISIAIFAGVVVYRFRKVRARLKMQVKRRQVNVQKIHQAHKDLRSEEKQLIQILAEKQGAAFEAELHERLNLPRTTTWRMIRRLETMGLVKISKFRRQNMVSVVTRYMQETGSIKRQKSK